MMAKDPEIDTFFSQLEEGMDVGHFLNKLDAIYGVTRRLGMAIEFRHAKGSMKSLRDEITPLARFVREFAKTDDRILKPKNDPPDFIVQHKDSEIRAIECTTAGAVARHYLNIELAVYGMSRGALGLTDDSSSQEFEAEMAKEPGMITTEQAYAVAAANLKLAIRKKFKITNCDTLLIEALNLWVLKEEAWHKFSPELTKIAAASNFKEVYYVAHLRPGEIRMRLK